jgi:phosphonate transport system permease protein
MRAEPLGALAGSQAALRRRDLTMLGFVALLVILSLGSSLVTSFSFIDALLSVPKSFGWLAANFVPDERAIASLPKILAKLGETVLVAIMASVTSAVVAVALAVVASRTTRPSLCVGLAIRALASACRNIPVVAWAMVFLLSFGQNILTGYLALFIGGLGFLTRAFIETIDEIAESSVEALRSSGSPWFAIVGRAVIPSVLPQFTSWLLYSVETNIRDATLVGILTGTGIGFLFDLYYKSMRYPSAALVVLVLVVATVAIEAGSNALRRVMA